MLVVLAIIVIITTIALLGQSSFNRTLILTDTAYTIAFSVREAQSLGISSRAFGGTQNAGYGVYFSAAAPSSYTLFADNVPAETGNIQSVSICPGHTVGTGPEARPGDCMYGNVSEVVRTYNLNNGFTVKSFSGTDTDGVVRSSEYLDAVNIVYLRPNTQSVINGIRSGTRVPLNNLTLRVASPDGAAERCIYVSKVGQVSVHAVGEANCP